MKYVLGRPTAKRRVLRSILWCIFPESQPNPRWAATHSILCRTLLADYFVIHQSTVLNLFSLLPGDLQIHGCDKSGRLTRRSRHIQCVELVMATRHERESADLLTTQVYFPIAVSRSLTFAAWSAVRRATDMLLVRGGVRDT